ncbi:hypothetical protein M2263_004450 [Providencia alcalifaciens]|nr:hypothetical protein [Providencia alcalifaciens]
MSTVPTNKPVPSKEMRDLAYNAERIDEFVTSLQHEYKDRFGQCHRTIEGINWVATQLIERFKVEMEQAILVAGYVPVGTFQEGAELANRNETVLWKLPDGDGDHYRWDGDLPKQVPAGSTPQSTGGIGKGAWVSVGDASLRGALSSKDGAGFVGVGDVDLAKYLSNLPCDVIVFSERDVMPAFASHDHILLRSDRIDGTIEIPAHKSLTVLPPIGERRNLLGGTGKKFILNRSSQFYAPSLACLDYEMDVVTIKGSTRPAMILGVGRPVVANFTIESEYRKGRGLVLDASTGSDNKAGIIAGIKVNASIKGMDTAYEEIASRNGTESDATYINNNDINLTIWQCRRGLIQQEYTHGAINKLEIAANNYFINYQTDAQSEDVIHIYGVRNTVDGHVWDYEYPKLHSTSILVKGNSNIVGSRNFPSITNQFVTVDSFVTYRNTYIGGTYGTDRQDIGQFTLLHRPYHFSDLTTPITMTSSLFFLKSERVIPSGNAVSIASRKLYYRSKDKLPLSLSGFAFIRNTSGSDANIRLGFGLSNIQGENSLSQTYTIANGGLAKIPITVLLTPTTLYIESGSNEWLGTPALSDNNGEITLVLSMTNNIQVTLCGCVLNLSKYDY